MFFRFSTIAKVFCLNLFFLLIFNIVFCDDLIKVCFSPLPPWKIVTDNRFEGPGAEIALSIAEKLGKKVEFAEMPFKRGLYYMEHGEFDLMTGLLKNNDRERYINYIEPPYKTRSNKAFYCLKESAAIIKKYEDLYSLNIGIQRAVSYFHRFDSDRRIKKHIVKKIRQCALMLINGRLDAFIATDSSADYILKSMGLQDTIVKSTYGFFDKNPVYIGISKKSKFNNPKTISVIRTMITNGEIDSIIIRFFNERGLPVPDYK